MLSLWLLMMNDPFGMNSWWRFHQTYRFPRLLSPNALPPAQVFVESLIGFWFEWFICWFMLKERCIWEETAMPHQMLRENDPWPRVPILDWHWELWYQDSLLNTLSLHCSHKRNRREIVWFQIYVCCVGPIFNLNLYVSDIFRLQGENWVVVVPKGLFLFIFQLKLKQT